MRASAARRRRQPKRETTKLGRTFSGSFGLRNEGLGFTNFGFRLGFRIQGVWVLEIKERLRLRGTSGFNAWGSGLSS